MRNKIYYICGGILFVIAIGLFINAGMQPQRVTNSVYRYNTPGQGEKHEKVAEIYKQSFSISKNKIDYTASFVPKYEATIFKDAVFYSLLFGEFTSSGNDGLEYVFENESSTLVIRQDYNYLHFSTSNTDSSKNTIISPLAAIDIAKEFISSKLLTLNYTEARVSNRDDGYSLKFLSKLDGLKNYAFPVEVQLDFYGNVKMLDYYFFEYDKLGSTKVLSMQEAFYELPVEGYESFDIDIKSCELVYFYEDSIVQPAYLFQGEIAGGGGFMCFIKASKYN